MSTQSFFHSNNISTILNIGSGFNGEVTSLDIDESGSLYVVGYFTTYKGSSIVALCRINKQGYQYFYNPHSNNNKINGGINEVAHIGSKQVIFGQDNISGIPCYTIGVSKEGVSYYNEQTLVDQNIDINRLEFGHIYKVRYNSSLKQTLVCCGGIVDFRAVIIYITDPNATYNNVITPIRISIHSGFFDKNIDPVIVYDAMFVPDGYVIAVGDFTGYNGNYTKCMVKLNPNNNTVKDDNFKINCFYNGIPYSIVKDSYNNMYSAGTFTMYDSDEVGNIASFNYTNGNLIKRPYKWLFTGEVKGMIITPQDTLILFGTFTKLEAYSTNTEDYGRIWYTLNANHICELYTDFSPVATFQPNYNSGFNSTVNTVKIHNNNLYIGGNFTSYNGNNCNRIAKLSRYGNFLTRTS